MLDIKFIRENPELVQKSAKNKGVEIDIDHILEIDSKRKELQLKVQSLREERNALNEQIKKNPDQFDKKKAQLLKQDLEKLEKSLSAVEDELKEYLLKIPNPAKSDVKVGKDDSENQVLRTEGSPKKFNFTPKDHLELGEALEIVDVKSAAKVSGARFSYLKGDAVLLEFALIQFGLETLIKEGFIPIVPPVLIKQEITQGLGYWQAGGNEDYYLVSDFNKEEGNTPNHLYLIGTAEHALVPMHKDEVLDLKDLPMRYIGFSSAFRREAGTYGKDTKGILRVHQFDKLEMVSFVKQGEDDKEHEFLLSLEEKLFKALDIPYQVVKMCTGDLGFPAARKYDLEAWLPGQNKYREVTSVSTVTDFQSRRLNIKYQDVNNKEYVNILNGTGFAIGRTIIAILENYQQEDGSIAVPEVLRKWVGKEKIIKKV